MLPKRGIHILLNEAVSNNLGIKTITRKFTRSSDDDNELLKLAFDLDLNLCFSDITNYTLDYAIAGHVAMFFDQEMLVMALPTKLSEEQYQNLMDMKETFDHKYMIIYSLEKTNRIEDLRLFYSQEKVVSNQQLLEQILLTKEKENLLVSMQKKRRL